MRKRRDVERRILKDFLNESTNLERQMFRCDCNNCPVCDAQSDLETQEHDDADYSLDYSVYDDCDEIIDDHSGASLSPLNPDDEGNVSSDDLYSHFDLDNDGNVSMDDYDDHISYHCEHPELEEDYMDIKQGRADNVHCHDSYSSCADHLMGDSQQALDAIEPVMSLTGATCHASAASALADILDLLKRNSLI